MSLEALFAPRRRFWILITVFLLTFVTTFDALRRLGELVELEKVPENVANQSIFELAEQNIATHLHLRKGGSEFRGDPSGTTTSVNEQQTIQTTQTTTGSVTSNTKPTSTQDKGTQSIATVTSACKASTVLQHTDYWGDALVWGTSNKKDTADKCCKSCSDYKPKPGDSDGFSCNVWVWCGDKDICKEHYRECWLKHLAHPYGTAPVAEGPTIGWTTGIMDKNADGGDVDDDPNAITDPNEDRRYHVVISAQGSAVHWQSRVHYYWYLKMKAKCIKEFGDKCQMGGFTRLLHSGEEDDLMNEIPTFVAQTLPAEHPDHGYIVLNRPYAFLQWVQKAKISEKYVLMGEPDHLWLKPMPNLMKGKRPAAFPFFYIEPSKREYFEIVQKFLGPVTRADTEHIAPIGSSPTLMRLDDLKNVVPLWFNLSIAVHNDEDAVKAWGWVQEMYAFTLACYKAGIKNIDLHIKWMSQPPWDTTLEPYYLLHYTYGMDYTLEGEFTPGKIGAWRFDKRSYAGLPPPRGLGEPPDGMTNELVRHLIHAINEASEAIPGWDEYAQTGVATQWWDGKTFLN